MKFAGDKRIIALVITAFAVELGLGLGIDHRSSVESSSKLHRTPSAECDLFGGHLRVNTSSSCCFTSQVVVQRALITYGLARQCKAAWDCEADGVTPKEHFQRMAHRELCAEPSCLGTVVAAMQQHSLLSKGAWQMGHLCDVATAQEGTHFLAETKCNKMNQSACKLQTDSKGYGRRLNETACKELRKKNDTESKSCYKECCAPRDALSACIPGDALVDVQGRGATPIKALRSGDKVLAEVRHGELGYEPLLGFLHSGVPGHDLVEVVHAKGTFRASGTHLVFIADGATGAVDTTVASLQPGQRLRISASVADASPPVTWSEIISVIRSRGVSRLHAPLTASGTLVVEGVITSNYASPSSELQLRHSWAHAALMPVRWYHALGLSSVLAPLWSRMCSNYGQNLDGSEKRWWLCQGDMSSVLEEKHPLIEIIHGQLRLDRWLPGTEM